MLPRASVLAARLVEMGIICRRDRIAALLRHVDAAVFGYADTGEELDGRMQALTKS